MKKRVPVWMTVFAILCTTAFITLPHFLPWLLSRYRPDVQFFVPTEDKKLYLTIDDAPSENTAEILRVLEKHGALATFFITADRVQTPAQLDAIVSRGHSLGNHLRTTKPCSELSLAEFRADFDACAALIATTAHSQLFRPSSDFGTTNQIAYARSKGFRPTMGTVFPLDHWITDSDWLVRITRWLTVRGGIVILHDGLARGQTTAQVLDRMIPEWKADGYSFQRLELADDVNHIAER